MKVASDGKRKYTLLTTAPAGKIPTAAELNAGMDISCEILTSSSTWTNAASETTDEKTECQKGNAQGLGAQNYDTALVFVRGYLPAPTGGVDVTGTDRGYQAVKTRGSEVWIYQRETDKDSTAPWAIGDEIHLGGRVVSDSPIRTDTEGSIKRQVNFLPQDMISEVLVAA